jgi:DNA invertase Pin-like site-specific DNA recombinase
MRDKIQATHHARRATVYLRQSTLKQVHVHRESTARQYALQKRAVDLGWQVDQVDVIDEDLGHSGSSTEGRTGFQRLAEEVADGRIGAIFALEVSRLARSSADWHRLLDLCGLSDVVIVDEQTVYTPRDYDDRLLLGLKGTMSEAEQSWMRLRLEGARLSKARRGELFLRPPTGYVWDEESQRFRFDPDEQVQRAVRLVFDRFRLDGSAYAVMRYFVAHGLKMPVRDDPGNEVRWSMPRHSLIIKMLHNPLYAGAYVFGRRETRRVLVGGQLRFRRVVKRAQQEWKVCLRDRHPAYLSWEEFMGNEHKLDANRTKRASADSQGAAREGSALLQGIALCGQCGHQMGVRYVGQSGRPYYVCHTVNQALEPGRRCFSVAGKSIDDQVAHLFLSTITPPEIELSLAVIREVERQADEIERQWKLRLERTRYEARVAERRYKAVDPEYRVVARTLEREWDDKLKEQEEVEREYQEARRQAKVDLTDTDRVRILALSKNLPRLFKAATTTHAERKNLLRMLVQKVALQPVEVPAPQTRVQVLWQTGAVSELFVDRPGPKGAQATMAPAIRLIQERCAQGWTDQRIASELNQRGLRTGKCHAWGEVAVRWVRARHRIRNPHLQRPGAPLPQRRADGLYSLHGVAERFGVTKDKVFYWIEQGWLRGAEGGRGRPWWFDLNQQTIQLLETKARRRRNPQMAKEQG